MRPLLILFALVPLMGIAQTFKNFTVVKLPENINSGYDEITPVPSRDGRTLYFTRVAYPDFEKYLWLDSVDYSRKLSPEKYDRMLSRIFTELGGKPSGATFQSPFNQDIWMAKVGNGSFDTLIHPGPPLNNALPNSVVSITPDPNALYILNQFKPSGDMVKGFSWIRRLADGSWDFPLPVDIEEYYTLLSEVNLTLSFDGKVLILAASRHDSRDLDLYVCFKKGEHKWSAPQHMGEVINSEKRELTPFLSEDNITLFFASNRWNSTGGLDLFVSRRQDETWKNWSPPLPLDAPINSASDESQPYFNMTTGMLYFTSKRDGSSDIYRVQIAPPQATELTIKGRVLNKKTGELIEEAMVRYGGESISDNFVNTTNGYFSLVIPKGVAIELIAEKTGFTGIPQPILFRRDYYYFKDYYTYDLYLDPLEKGAKIELRPIYFRQSKAEILESSFPELERLGSLLRSNPNIHIKINGHTDNQGSPAALQQLSEERAAAIKNHLTTQSGIDPERIRIEGFGASQPINDNSSDELRQLNRRVEVFITQL